MSVLPTTPLLRLILHCRHLQQNQAVAIHCTVLQIAMYLKVSELYVKVYCEVYGRSAKVQKNVLTSSFASYEMLINS